MAKHLRSSCQRTETALRMADGPSHSKRARKGNGPVNSCQVAGELFDFLLHNMEKGADYLTCMSELVSRDRQKTFELKNPAGATLKIGGLDDTIYREEVDEVKGWGRFYLPKIVNMMVIGVVEGTSCTSDQLVLMTCEDKELYAYDGDELHLVASSLEELRYKGLQYPASKRYYSGEAFKTMTEDNWAKVRKMMDQEHRELVESIKSEFLENLTLIRLRRNPENPHAEHATKVLGSNPKPSCCVT